MCCNVDALMFSMEDTFEFTLTGATFCVSKIIIFHGKYKITLTQLFCRTS